jgi:hypothetical protein
MEALPRPEDTSTKINAAADDKISTSTAAGHSPAVGLKNISTANHSTDCVAKLAVPMAKKPTLVENLGESTGQVSITRPERKVN